MAPSVKSTLPMTGACRSVYQHESMNSRCRRTMEDACRVVEKYMGSSNIDFLAVYDGHGGRGMAEFIEYRLEENIAREILADDGSSMEQRLKRAYIVTDLEGLQEIETTSGATAVTCIVRRDEDEIVIYTANVGDSRAVLCRDGKAVRLSKDHKAEEKSEQERIAACGGFIHKDRALGILAVTRSFGDHSLKKYITAEPYVSAIRLAPLANQFLILACDGVWDVISDQEAVDFVRKLHDTGNEAESAKFLVEEALERGSSDNITVVVAFL